MAWLRLTPRGHELLEQIAFRAAADFEPTEIARILDTTRPELKHLELPEQVTSWWLRNRMAELRAES